MAERGGVYVRVHIDSGSGSFIGRPASADQVGLEDPEIDLVFVDLVTRDPTPSDVSDRLTSAIQEHAHLLASSDRVVVRWPWLNGPDVPPDTALIDRGISRLKGEGATAVIPESTEVAVHQHTVGNRGHTRWSGPAPQDEEEILAHARAIELHALMRRSNAIWEPGTYHYVLPNGQHVDSFVRLADAIQSPRDAFAISSWLTPRLSNGVGLVADNGTMTPILLQLEAFLERFKWEIGRISILESYPSGRSAVRGTIEQAVPDFGTAIVGIQSVSSSGTLRRLFADELERAGEAFGTEFSLDILVDRSKRGRDCNVLNPKQPAHEVSWLGLADPAFVESSGRCPHCSGAQKPHFVGIDSRTYAQMVLPEPFRVMPDVAYADNAHLFWERAQETRAIAIEASPHPLSRVARGKRIALPVRISFELFAKEEGLLEAVSARAAELRTTLRKLNGTKLIVVSPGDIEVVSQPAFVGGTTDLLRSLQVVLDGIGLDPSIPIVPSDDAELTDKVKQLGPGDDILLFSWGSVTGLTMRHLKQAIAGALASRDDEVGVNAFVVHGRPSSPQEWNAARNQLRPGELVALWSSYFPWESPLADEIQLLDRASLDPTTLNADAQTFLSQRFQFLQYHSTFIGERDDWSPRFQFQDTDADPTFVFWGMSASGLHQKHVRGRSLYGKGLTCMSAYAAIGSAIHYTRNNEKPSAAPKWIMFDMNKLVRSYFDAVIVASVLRWLRPGELWWAGERNDPASNRDSVAYLLEQAEGEIEEQVLLYPELLLASAQGKLPLETRELLVDKVRIGVESWPDDPGLEVARGATELGLVLQAEL